jgi:excisionase family DNA binding protein
MTVPAPVPVVAPDDLQCLSIPQVASLLGISRAGVYVFMSRGELAALKIGSRRVCTLKAVRDFIASRVAV